MTMKSETDNKAISKEEGIEALRKALIEHSLRIDVHQEIYDSLGLDKQQVTELLCDKVVQSFLNVHEMKVYEQIFFLLTLILSLSKDIFLTQAIDARLRDDLK